MHSSLYSIQILKMDVYRKSGLSENQLLLLGVYHSEKQT